MNNYSKTHVWLSQKLILMLTLVVLGVLTAGTQPVRAAGIVISEIMYNPVVGENDVDGDEFEFIELYNAGEETEDLTSASFTKGIDHTFSSGTSLAPGACLVVVKNLPIFERRYPDLENIAPGEYSGSLANSGEKVTLKDADGITIFSVTYNDSEDWPERADGTGCSLVLIDPDGDPDSPYNWCASAQFNGSPGEEGACAINDIVINEILTHSDLPLEDAIELHNLTDEAIDITGWYLSDEAEVPKKYKIPDTVIQAHDYIVFYEYQFNDNNPDNIAFALNSVIGDKIYLNAADISGYITRFVDMVEFEAAENGFSFGRYPDGTGTLVTMDELTFGTANPPDLETFRTGEGAPNAYPKVGPVVINEIMYHPPDTGDPPQNNSEDEYIELHNISEYDVDLYDPEYPTNTWKITSAVDFTFPTNVTIPAGGYILIVGTTDIQTFRSTYWLAADVPIFGPWSGKLNNASDNIRLYKPDEPTPDMVVPYILVDRVDYKDNDPWPVEPDGEGCSLERKDIPGLGSDPANWQASPVRGTPGKLNGSSNSVCFIATAAFGSPMERHVCILKDFRDTCLLQNVLGRMFVESYYTCSPPVACFIAQHETLRGAVRAGLLPLIVFAYAALHFGVKSTVSVSFLAFVLTIILVSFCGRRLCCHMINKWKKNGKFIYKTNNSVRRTNKCLLR